MGVLAIDPMRAAVRARPPQQAMFSGRQWDYSQRGAVGRSDRWKRVYLFLARRNLQRRQRASNSTEALTFALQRCNIHRMRSSLNWPVLQGLTSRNRYFVCPLISACILLRRLSSPKRWRGLEEMLGKHASQLSEIFWEAEENFIDERQHLFKSPLQATFLSDRSAMYVSAIRSRTNTSENCVRFIDEKAIAIARLGDYQVQKIAYNGHKKKHGVKYQAVTTPDGLVLHCAGPVEGRRQEWTLYVSNVIEGQSEETLSQGGAQYCIYGDSGYAPRLFLEVPFQESQLTGELSACNQAMSAARIAVKPALKKIKL